MADWDRRFKESKLDWEAKIKDLNYKMEQSRLELDTKDGEIRSLRDT